MKIRFVGLSFLFILPLLSCAENKVPQKEVRPVIRLAYSWAYGFEELVARKAEEYEGKAELRGEFHPGLDLKQKILVDFAGGDLPDLFFFWSYETNLAELASAGELLDVNEYFALSQEVGEEDFYKETMDSVKVGGIPYGVPHEQFYGYMAVNRELLERYELPFPESWEDIRLMAEKLEGTGIVPLSMGSFRGDPAHLFFSALSYQTSGGYEDAQKIKDGGPFINAGSRAAVDAIEQLIGWNAVPRDSIFAGSWDNQTNLYNREKAVMIYAFTWTQALFDPAVADKTELIPIPRIPGGVRDPNSFIIGGCGQSLCIKKASWEDPKKRRIIMELTDWLLGEEVYGQRQKHAGIYPARKIEMAAAVPNSLYGKVEDHIAGKEVLKLHEFFFPTLKGFHIYKEANDMLWSGALQGDAFLMQVEQGLHGAP